MNTHLPTLSDEQDAQTPLPLIVARKWGFPLAFVETQDGVYYNVQEWIAGLTEASLNSASKLWNDMIRRSDLEQLSDSIRKFPYIATNGKTYQVDYTDDKALYLVAQHMRVTKARPALATIKQFLAEAGAFVDLVRREPETVVTSGAIDPDKALDAVVQYYRRQGKDDNWISARLTGIVKRNQFTAALKEAVVEMLTKTHYALATDDVYVGLWERTAAKLRQQLELPKGANLRDHQPALALTYQALAEEVCAKKLGNQTELTLHEARDIIKQVAKMIGVHAKEVSLFLNLDIPTGKPLLRGENA
jgi:hypothetical protein